MSEQKLRLNLNSRMEAVQSPLIPVIGELILDAPPDQNFEDLCQSFIKNREVIALYLFQ